MERYLIVCLLFGVAFCLLDSILDQIVAATNTNNNGTIEPEEISAYILTFDTNGNGVVEKPEFIQEWVARYYDTSFNANSLFNNLDASGDGTLTDLDLAIHDANNRIDTDNDGVISIAEYRAFITLMYP